MDNLLISMYSGIGAGDLSGCWGGVDSAFGFDVLGDLVDLVEDIAVGVDGA